MKNLDWPAVTYRVFAIGNVLVVLIGLLFCFGQLGVSAFGLSKMLLQTRTSQLGSGR
jgi:hypothetical protein